MRSTAREVVFKYLFAELFNPSDEGLFAVLAKDAKLNNEDFSFAKELLGAVLAKKDFYFTEIERLSIGFKLNRIFGADKCALILGMAELETFPNTDVPVIIDEAVKLGAKFSTEKSTDFINGLLAEYANEIRKE